VKDPNHSSRQLLPSEAVAEVCTFCGDDGVVAWFPGPGFDARASSPAPRHHDPQPAHPVRHRRCGGPHPRSSLSDAFTRGPESSLGDREAGARSGREDLARRVLPRFAEAPAPRAEASAG